VATLPLLWLGCGGDTGCSSHADASSGSEASGDLPTSDTPLADASDAVVDRPIDLSVDAVLSIEAGPADASPAFSDNALGLSEPCNTDPALCDKTYDRVTYGATHAAMAYAFPPFPCPSQRQTVRGQLDQGIRALSFEVHPSHASVDGGGAPALCLADCAAGELPMAIALGDVRAYLDVNPREVVTLFFDGGADAQVLASAIVSAKLDSFALARAVGDPWPTLRHMIAVGTRVVVLANVTGTGPAWMLPLTTYVAATGTNFTTPQTMTCDVARGANDAPLFLLNHFLVDGPGGSSAAIDGGTPLAPGCDDPQLAHVVNTDPFFSNRVTACRQLRGVKPNFVAMDFFDDGALSFVLRALNGGT